MILRSILFVPGDSERKITRAASSQADAIMLDLEDAVAEANKPLARETVAEFVSGADDKLRSKTWVRLNSLASGLLDQDLAIVGGRGIAGYMLPKAKSAANIVTLATKLDGIERPAHIKPPSILAMATEVPEALFNLGSYRPGTPRLTGLSWGAEDLATGLGATANQDENGEWAFVYALARSLTLAAARSAGVVALDTVYTDYRDLDGAARYAAAARRDGFDGMLAIHPDQIEIINQAFTPSADEVRRAQRIVDAFAGQPDSGAIGMDGRMLDVPHRKQAERILNIAAILRATSDD